MKVAITKSDYTWDNANKKLTLTGLATVQKERLLAIVNADTQTPIFKINDSAVTVAVEAPNKFVFTGLTTTSWTDDENFYIVYDDPRYDAGKTDDTAIVSDSNGTLSGKIRGLVKILADVWDSANHVLKVSTLPLQNTIDSISTYKTGGYIMNGLTAVPVQTVIANVAVSQTDQVLVVAVSGKKIYVLGFYGHTGATATNVTLNSKGSGAGTAISPILPNGANTGEVLPVQEFAWYSTNVSEGLTVTTGEGSTTAVTVIYAQY